MRFTFEIDGQVQFDRAFNRVKEHLEDLRPVWNEVERAFYKIENEQFASEGAKGRGGKWRPLSRPYAKQKARKWGVQPILRASGRLAKSLTGNTSDSVLVQTKQEFAIGTKLFYATFHQQGTSRMPQREVIAFSDAQRTDIQKAMQKGLLRIIRGDAVISRSLNIQD